MLQPIPLHERLSPNPDAPQWAQIAQWDRRVWACHLVWDCHSVVPAANLTEQQKADSAARYIKLESRHANRESYDLEEITRQAREMAQRESDGWDSHHELEVLRVHRRHKALATHDLSDGKLRHFDYCDEAKDATFDQWFGIPDNEAHWTGTVRLLAKDEAEYEWEPQPDGTSIIHRFRPMSNTVSGVIGVLLMGMPVAVAYPPASTHLAVDDQTLRLTEISTTRLLITRLTLARDTGLPSCIETLDWSGRVRGTTRVEAWRTVAGLQIPETIVNRDVDAAPEDYQSRKQLRSATLNEAVEEDALLFPIGAGVWDYRLDTRSPAKDFVNYTITDGHLPSDAQVRKIQAKRYLLNWIFNLGVLALAALAAVAAWQFILKRKRGLARC